MLERLVSETKECPIEKFNKCIDTTFLYIKRQLSKLSMCNMTHVSDMIHDNPFCIIVACLIYFFILLEKNFLFFTIKHYLHCQARYSIISIVTILKSKNKAHFVFNRKLSMNRNYVIRYRTAANQGSSLGIV